MALTLHGANCRGLAKYWLNALLLLAMGSLLNGCGGSATETSQGGGTIAACISGPAPTVLSWDAVSVAAGYRIYSRTASGTFTLLQQVGNTTTLPVNGLVSGTTYYFSATAIDASNPPNESNISNVICKTIS